jgi:hypothetical protein
MDHALEAAIRLFTRALDDAGVDAGALALRGAVPSNVTELLANCTTYRGEDDGGLTYLILGLTADFKAFIYPPHCRLFLIINSTGICEDPAAASILKAVAPGQFPAPMIDAHLMRRWIQYILPLPAAMQEGPKTLKAFHERLMADLMGVIRSVPAEWAEKVDLHARFKDWAAGYPASIGQRLTPEVKRMNGLPMTPFIADLLTDFLAQTQMRGLAERNRA